MRRAIILAGGRGTRVRPYTLVIPKPLMPVGEVPIHEIIIRQLANRNFGHITIAVNYQVELFKAYFGDGQKWRRRGRRSGGGTTCAPARRYCDEIDLGRGALPARRIVGAAGAAARGARRRRSDCLPGTIEGPALPRRSLARRNCSSRGRRRGPVSARNCASGSPSSTRRFADFPHRS
jgi:hypothetical protein